MEKIVNELLKEELYYEKLENGLDVYFMPKKGFTKKYAVLATNYGSNDLEFIPIGETEPIRVNEGIAHFLEHKMFEQPDESDAFEKFSKWGANANAFTNFTTTAYLFTTTENFYDCLDHLFDYVQTPHFTDENVEKEKGIIAQEIKMYDDDPGWNVSFNAIKAMYVNHPVRVDIAGTVDSVYKITKEELYKCYNTFYNPGNMALFVIGDLEAEEFFDNVKKANKYDMAKMDHEITRIYPEEPTTVNKKEIITQAPISMPIFNIGFKDDKVNIKGKELLRYEVITDILNDMLFRRGSELYEDLYMKGLINRSFGAGFTSQIDYSFTTIGGESKQPKEVKKIIFEYIDKYKKEGLDRETFERVKKSSIGNFIKYFDSLTFIANNFIFYKFKDINLLDYVEVIKEVTFEEVQQRLEDHFREDNCVISIVEPLDDSNK